MISFLIQIFRYFFYSYYKSVKMLYLILRSLEKDIYFVNVTWNITKPSRKCDWKCNYSQYHKYSLSNIENVKTWLSYTIRLCVAWNIYIHWLRWKIQNAPPSEKFNRKIIETWITSIPRTHMYTMTVDINGLIQA
jgi:hypothetical protein